MTAAQPGVRQPAGINNSLGRVPRIIGAALAVLTALAFVGAGFAWWWLPALFVVFDISGAGYLGGLRAGSISYNLVHNYVAPAVLLAVFAGLHVAGSTIQLLALVAGCWFFHVALDRALGFGPHRVDAA